MKKEGTNQGKLNIKEKMAKHMETYMLNHYLDYERLPSVSEVKAHIQTVFKFVIYPQAHRKYTDYILDMNRKLSKSIKYKRQRAQEIAQEIWPSGTEINENFGTWPNGWSFVGLLMAV